MFLVKLVLRLGLYVIAFGALAALAFLITFVGISWLVSLLFGGMKDNSPAIFYGFIFGGVAGLAAAIMVALAGIEMYFKRVLVPAAEPYFSDQNLENSLEHELELSRFERKN